MDTHFQGRILDTINLGAVPVLRGYEFDLTTTSQQLCTVDGQGIDPVLMEFFPSITTAFNAGTTNVVTLTNQNGTVLYTYSDPTTVGIQAYQFILTFTKTILTINYTYTGTKPTTGQGIFMIRISGLGKGATLNLGKL